MHLLRPLAALLVVVLSACGAGTRSTPAPPATPEVTGPAAPMTSEPVSAAPSPTTAVTSSPAAATPTPRLPDALLDAALLDVRSGESFTLAELAARDGPLLLEPMAIWCTNCRAQQREVVRAHELAAGSFSSVSLDVDLSEAPDDLAGYADAEGFAWRFAMADAALYRLLQERFGVAATNPPSTPLIVIERDLTVRPLEFGVGTRSAEQLLAELGAS